MKKIASQMGKRILRAKKIVCMEERTLYLTHENLPQAIVPRPLTGRTKYLLGVQSWTEKS
jgi:hypothetical protein